MDGVLVVDKPRGPTSFDVVAKVRKALGARRVGHTGTLDPMATGVLPICVGEATKLVPYLTAADKAYEAEALLGVTTDTLDADGQVLVTRDASGVTRAQVEAALAGFVGTIRQRPPAYSAIRVGGKRLYEHARAGTEVEVPEREVEVRECRLLAFEPPRVSFAVSCGKGTYIRTIAADLGERLGVGAHLVKLRRTRVGRFTEAAAVPLEAVGPEVPLLGLAEALADWPAVPLTETQASDVRQGKVQAVARLKAPDAPWVRLLRPDGRLLAVAEHKDGRLRLSRVFG